MIVELTKNNLKLLQNSFLIKEVVEQELTNNPFARYFIYIEKDKILGYIYYSSIYDRIEINQIEVKEEKRNSGIGTKLLKKLIETENKNITLEVKKDNIPALKLYKKFGFEDKSIRKSYYEGIDGILMERKNKTDITE